MPRRRRREVPHPRAQGKLKGGTSSRLQRSGGLPAGRRFDMGTMAAVRISVPAVLLAVLVAAGCGGGDKKTESPPPAPATIKVTSPAFKNDATLPVRFTCDGRYGGINPPLQWSNKPKGTKSQA